MWIFFKSVSAISFFVLQLKTPREKTMNVKKWLVRENQLFTPDIPVSCDKWTDRNWIITTEWFYPVLIFVYK